MNARNYARWHSQYGEMKADEAWRLAKLEGKNQRRKHSVADQVLDMQMLKYVAEGGFQAFSGNGRRP